MQHKYEPNPGWFSCNIKDIGLYVAQMRSQVVEFEEPEGLTPRRLQEAIEEDTFGRISLPECASLLRRY